MNESQPFRVATADDGSIRVRGELDISNVRLLQDHVDDVIECDAGDIVVDLFHVTFIDAAGLRALVSTDLRLCEAGRRRLRLVTPSPAVLRLLNLAGLTEHFAPLPEPLPVAN